MFLLGFTALIKNDKNTSLQQNNFLWTKINKKIKVEK